MEDKLMKFLYQNSNDNETNVGNDKENSILLDNEVKMEYLKMKENAICFINSYIAKQFDDDIFIGLITNYKCDFWCVEYDDGDKEDFDVIDLKKGIQLYKSLKKRDNCMSSDNEVRKDDDIVVNEFLSMKRNAMEYINSSIAKKV